MVQVTWTLPWLQKWKLFALQLWFASAMNGHTHFNLLSVDDAPLSFKKSVMQADGPNLVVNGTPICSEISWLDPASLN